MYYPYYGKLRQVSENAMLRDNIYTFIFNSEITALMSWTCVFLLSQTNYSAPVMAVRFAGVQYDSHIVVQCKLHGKGIINDSPTDRNLGRVSFSLDIGA